jgi:D-glycero-alpha-D-manno-heptose-7-phosphate kinase
MKGTAARVFGRPVRIDPSMNRKKMHRSKDPVQVRVPTRIDLAGGTVDIWPLYLFHPGAVTVNAAVDLWAELRATPLRRRGILVHGADGRLFRPTPATGHRKQRLNLYTVALDHLPTQGGLGIEVTCRAPQGSGLGGSSSLLVGLCAALLRLRGQPIVRKRLLDLVRDLETRLLGVPAGTQDFYAALWGGVQAIRWEPGGPVREVLRIETAELEKRILLLYTGKSRNSGTNNWQIFRNHLDGDKRVRIHLEQIAFAARGVRKALLRRDFEEVGRWMAEEARARKRLSPGIVTPEIQSLESAMGRHGAAAVKVCGAGGGGCVAVYGRPDQKNDLGRLATQEGFTVLPFHIVPGGLQVRSSLRREVRGAPA